MHDMCDVSVVENSKKYTGEQFSRTCQDTEWPDQDDFQQIKFCVYCVFHD